MNIITYNTKDVFIIFKCVNIVMEVSDSLNIRYVLRYVYIIFLFTLALKHLGLLVILDPYQILQNIIKNNIDYNFLFTKILRDICLTGLQNHF